jgi:hypothetical protein
MNGESTNRMDCAGFEALLAEAVEGRLKPAQDAEFRSHAQACPTCGPMLADAVAGFELLHELPDVTPPRNLVHNILISTSGVASASKGGRTPASELLRQWLLPVFTPMLQPRVAGSLAMTFFSLTLILSLAGFRISDLRKVDLRPSAIRQGVTRQYYETSAKVVKYYDSMRIVYQLQSGLRDFKNQITPPEQEQQPSEQKKEKDDKDITRRPQPKREQDNYSQRAGSMRLASSQPISTALISTPQRRDG